MPASCVIPFASHKTKISEDSLEEFRRDLSKRLDLSKKFDELLCVRKISEDVLAELKAEGDSNKLFSTARALECGFIDKEIQYLAPYIS
jgi:hypothetical protein